MEKNLPLFVLISVFLVFAGIASVSAVCQLTPQLVSQNPYPAVPGQSVQLVFQVNGIENPDCSQVTFELVPNFPLSFNPGSSPYFSVQGGTYAGVNYGTYVMVPYTVNINPMATDGNDTIDLRYTSGGPRNVSVDNYFNLSVQNVLSSFQVFVNNYNPVTHDLTLEIINTGKNDVQALTVEIPDQNNVTVQGPNYNVVGSLSAGDYSTADFTVLPYKGNINLTIYYNDITGTRRNVSESFSFNPDRFAAPPKTTSPAVYIVLVLIVIIIVYFIYRRHKKNKKKKLLRE